MRILHLCLACFYIDSYSYQENVLPRVNHEDGNEVLIIASTETYADNRTLGYVEPNRYMTEFGVPIIRLPYALIGPMSIRAKLRKYKGLYEEIDKFSPDVIMSHDLCYWSVTDVVDYVKRHKNVRLYADTHTAAYNSGQNWVSLNILHRVLYKHWIQKAVPYVSKYFYIGQGEKLFSSQIYKVPESKMEFYPIGGFPLGDDTYNQYRSLTRKELGLHDGQLLLVHSGKMNGRKKTIDLIKAFQTVKDLDAKLVIFGSVGEDIKYEFDGLVKDDDRIEFLGWKNADELQRILCAGDLYLQPGSVSATMQNAICCRCPILAYPHEAYVNDFDYGQFIWVRDEGDMRQALLKLRDKEYDLSLMSIKSQQCATEILDYRLLASKLYT